MNKKKLIAICGPSGSGKSFLLNKFRERYPSQFNYIVSCTSRPPREGEIDGLSYNFLTSDEVGKLARENQFLELSSFRDWYYGTLSSSLVEDKTNIGIFNVDGIESIIKHPELDSYIFYVNVPDKLRLIRSLNREENPDIEEIIRRYYADKADFQQLETITFKKKEVAIISNISNNDVNRAIKILGDFI